MVIIRTSAVEVSIQAVSPVSSLGLSSAASASAGKSNAAIPAKPPSDEWTFSFIVLPSRPKLLSWLAGLERIGAGLAGADADRLLDAGDEDLAVADLAGAGRLADRLDRTLDHGVVDHDLDLDLGQEAHRVLGPTIDLGLAFLPTEASHFAHRQTLDAERRQGIPHLFQLERLGNRHDQFHCAILHRAETPLTRRRVQGACQSTERPGLMGFVRRRRLPLQQATAIYGGCRTSGSTLPSSAPA